MRERRPAVSNSIEFLRLIFRGLSGTAWPTFAFALERTLLSAERKATMNEKRPRQFCWGLVLFLDSAKFLRLFAVGVLLFSFRSTNADWLVAFVFRRFVEVPFELEVFHLARIVSLDADHDSVLAFETTLQQLF